MSEPQGETPAAEEQQSPPRKAKRLPMERITNKEICKSA